MTKIVIPDDLTIMHSEAKRLREERDSMELQRNNCMLNYQELREELAKVREVNAEQANQIAYWRDRAHHAEDQLRRAQQNIRSSLEDVVSESDRPRDWRYAARSGE